MQQHACKMKALPKNTALFQCFRDVATLHSDKVQRSKNMGASIDAPMLYRVVTSWSVIITWQSS